MQRADTRRYHYIYKITRDDGKYYIGMHSTDELEDGYFGSGKLITRSVKKHGVERHQKEIVEFLPSRIALKERERQLVNEEIVANLKCMNLQLGGGGGFINEQHREKFLEAASKTGIVNMTALHGKRSFADRSRMAKKAAQTKKRENVPHNWLGKNHSEETKVKMSASMQGKQTGEKNSQFGTCWVTNGAKSIKIKKEQLNEYLANGYTRGRTMEMLAELAELT